MLSMYMNPPMEDNFKNTTFQSTNKAAYPRAILIDISFRQDYRSSRVENTLYIKIHYT